MSKKYFVSWETLTQAERMVEKISSEISKKELKLEDAFDKEHDVLIKEIQDLQEKRSEIRLALNNVTGERKAEWKYIEILRGAENERGVLDNQLGINIF